MAKNYDKIHADWADKLFNGGRNPKELVKTNSLNGESDIDKISRYGWIVKDDRGTYKQINKNLIVVEPAYQRAQSHNMIMKLAAKWSWIACGTISVVERENKYYAIDGQHRVMAAQMRSDIDTLDCMVYNVKSLVGEARGFVDCNINSRCLVSALDTFKAQLMAEDPDAMYLEKIFTDFGLHAGKSSTNPKYIGWIRSCYKMMKASRPKFEQTMSIVKEMGERYKEPVPEKLAHGLFYINMHLSTDFEDPRLRTKIMSFTIKEYIASIRDAIVMGNYSSYGAANVYAKGILDLINKKRSKYKYVLRPGEP